MNVGVIPEDDRFTIPGTFVVFAASDFATNEDSAI